MKRITTIALFAGIFAVTVGTLSFSGISATSLMVSSLPQSQENVGMLGHVEYKVLDEVGNIKHYMQNDNIVVQTGKDCTARAVFATGTNPGKCSTTADFKYIAIGNKTAGTIDAAQTTLNGGVCADTTNDGEMARRAVTPSFTTATGSTGTIVVLDTASVPFTFGASNATAVADSGVFNADEGSKVGSTGQCATLGSAQMFSIQKLNADTGITVSNGDSLSVKWTITVG